NAGGSTDKAGLKAGDVLTAIGEKPIRNYADVLEQIRARKVGDKVKVKATRAGKEMEVELTYAARTARPGPRRGGPGQRAAGGQGQRGGGTGTAAGGAGQRGGGGQRGGEGLTGPFSAQLGGQQENVQDQQGRQGTQYGGVYKSTDGGETWTRLNSINP